MCVGTRSPSSRKHDSQSTAPKSWRDTLKVHPAAELFPLMSREELLELGEDIKERGLHTSITIWKAEKHLPPELLDGRNRLGAMEVVGFAIEVENVGSDADPAIRLWMRQSPKHVPMRIEIVEVRGDRPGGDPYAYVISANIHRRHLTPEQKRDLIAKLLKATPEKSNRQIAETVKASHHTVEAVRTKMESTGQIAQLPKTVGKDRKARSKPKRRTVEDFQRDLAAKKAAVPKPSPPKGTVREVVAADEEIDLLREFARFVIGRAKSVSTDPKDYAEWKLLLGRVKAVLGGAS